MNRRGFTMLEMLLVVAVIVALTAIVYPSFEPMYRQYRVSAAADTVKAGMLQARAQAVEEGRPYVFGVVYGKGNFRVAPEGQSYWSNGGSNDQPDENGLKLYIYEEALPRDMVFLEKATDAGPASGEETSSEAKDLSPNQYKQLVTFLPDGTARANVELTLKHVQSDTRAVNVQLRGLTGEVTIRRGAAELNGDR